MRTPVAVVVPDAVSARVLEDRLHPLGPTIVERGGTWHVELETGDDATLSQLLSAVDRWLADSGEQSALVIVSGHEYVMERVPQVAVSAGEPARMPDSLPRSSPA